MQTNNVRKGKNVCFFSKICMKETISPSVVSYRVAAVHSNIKTMLPVPSPGP